MLHVVIVLYSDIFEHEHIMTWCQHALYGHGENERDMRNVNCNVIEKLRNDYEKVIENDI